MMLKWPSVLGVINAPGDFFTVTRMKLWAILGVAVQNETIQLELVLVHDAGEALVLLCYLDEGDSFLSPRVFMRITVAEAKVRTMLDADGIAGFHAPTLVAIATRLYHSRGPRAVAEAILRTIKKAKKVLAKLVTLKTTVWAKQMKVWQFCRLFDPAYVAVTSTATLHEDIMCHTAIPSLGNCADGLKSELSAYVAAAAGVPAGSDLCLFWRVHGGSIPLFDVAARVAAILQPSSAAAERVFALLNWMFTKQQSRSHEVITPDEIQRGVETEDSLPNGSNGTVRM
jgi:hypothetical protein